MLFRISPYGLGKYVYHLGKRFRERHKGTTVFAQKLRPVKKAQRHKAKKRNAGALTGNKGIDYEYDNDPTMHKYLPPSPRASHFAKSYEGRVGGRAVDQGMRGKYEL